MGRWDGGEEKRPTSTAHDTHDGDILTPRAVLRVPLPTTMFVGDGSWRDMQSGACTREGADNRANLVCREAKKQCGRTVDLGHAPPPSTRYLSLRFSSGHCAY